MMENLEITSDCEPSELKLQCQKFSDSGAELHILKMHACLEKTRYS